MKLISLNVEGDRHYDSALTLIDTEAPDVICLQEAAEAYIAKLEALSYHVSYLPRAIKENDAGPFTDGQLLCTKEPHTITKHYYYGTGESVQKERYNPKTQRHNSNRGILLAKLEADNQKFLISTIHFTWAPEGRVVSKPQVEDMESLLEYVKTLPPHILCGDFNIPRHHNALYEKLTNVYTDNIPETYLSSLDKKHHRVRNDPEKAHVLTDFMVDYVFSQPPYEVSDVRLEFGISDHAAVIATINRTDQ